MIEKCFQNDFDVGLTLRPPMPRYEHAPESRAGHTWIPGYWNWDHNKHIWVEGYWVSARPGYRWQRHRWVQREGRWYLQQGGWACEAPEALTLRAPRQAMLAVGMD